MTATTLPKEAYSADVGIRGTISDFAAELRYRHEELSAVLTRWDVAPVEVRNKRNVYRLRDIYQAIRLGAQDDPEQMSPLDRARYYTAESKRLDLEKKAGLLMSVKDHQEETGELARIFTDALALVVDELERDMEIDALVLDYIEKKLNAAREEVAARIEDHE